MNKPQSIKNVQAIIIENGLMNEAAINTVIKHFNDWDKTIDFLLGMLWDFDPKYRELNDAGLWEDCFECDTPQVREDVADCWDYRMWAVNGKPQVH